MYCLAMLFSRVISMILHSVFFFRMNRKPYKRLYYNQENSEKRAGLVQNLGAHCPKGGPFRDLL